jgi:NADH dehydrogenase [ubiquinone] 1 alpha subcomplex assembly factor 7
VGAAASGRGAGGAPASRVGVSASGLAEKIARRIRREGPLSLAAFMAVTLHDPEDGYYARRHPIGSAGDFITAPEISQVFGELLGLCCAEWWQRSGCPDAVILAELGPGRGALMQDFLRAAASVPEFRRTLRLHLVEASPLLRAEQQRRLGATEPRFVVGVDELPVGPLILVANEFLDALPIRQLARGRSEWAERIVGLDPEGRLAFVETAESPALSLLVPPSLRESPPGSIVEVGPAAAALAANLGERLARSPGLALFIDYGYFPSATGPTLAAIRDHRPADPLTDPGSADLSAHVDFAAVAAAAESAGAIVHGPVSQRDFLRALGAEARLAVLSARASPEQRIALESGLRRLIDPAQMGNLFQVLALTSPGLPAPAGFFAAPAAGSEPR